jgi:hypothetical protein
MFVYVHLNAWTIQFGSGRMVNLYFVSASYTGVNITDVDYHAVHEGKYMYNTNTECTVTVYSNSRLSYTLYINKF